MLRWLRNYFARHEAANLAAEEKEYFDGWEEAGFPDRHPLTGEEIRPRWDAEAGKWDYSEYKDLDRSPPKTLSPED